MERPLWLRWAESLRTIARAGLAYSRDPFDLDRFRQLDALSLEMLARHTDLPEQGGLEVLRSEKGYITPKVDVRACLFDAEGRVLLVREIADGRWSLPGGWADVGESAAEVAVREVREETGLTARATKLIALFDRSKHPHPVEPWYVYKVFFRCERLGGELAASAETPEVNWFPRETLPPLSVNRVTEDELELAFAHRDDPGRVAEFD